MYEPEQNEQVPEHVFLKKYEARDYHEEDNHDLDDRLDERRQSLGCARKHCRRLWCRSWHHCLTGLS